MTDVNSFGCPVAVSQLEIITHAASANQGIELFIGKIIEQTLMQVLSNPRPEPSQCVNNLDVINNDCN